MSSERTFIRVVLILLLLAVLGLCIANVVISSKVLDRVPKSSEIKDTALTLVLSRCILRSNPDLLVPESKDLDHLVFDALDFNVGRVDTHGGWDAKEREYVIPEDGLYQIETKLNAFVVQNRGRSIYMTRRYDSKTERARLDQVSIWCNKNTNQGEAPFDKLYTSYFNKGDRVSVAFSYNDNDVDPPPSPTQLPTRLSHANQCGSNLLLIYAVNTL